MYSRTLLMLVIIAGNFSVLAQSLEQRSLELKQLAENVKKEEAARQQRVKEFITRTNRPSSYRDYNGNLVLLIDVDERGVPQYLSTDNQGAAITTGVVALRENGGLGLNLEGEGLSVGVWDGGAVGHDEFSSRIFGTQGSPDNHANHVTGTIAAQGINPLAKGMAPKATIYSFDFNADASEMLTLVTPDQNSLLLSNHSYGLITGWYFNGSSWQWFGGDDQEDSRFGFYTNRSAQYDQIAFNAPYYTIMKSAGNDRSDAGNGTRPADCNGGSGYDCISDVSTAKNIITVGAVSKVTNYTGPNSVQMSSFSSWGPTDDGRIKPDFVAAGVSLFSTITNNSYGNLSGTSMATPNATGSLLLLQELHKNLHEGAFMRSSTLKALAIHSVKEAGFNPGPDYRFGWGLLDVEAAAKVLLNEDGNGVRVDELTLLNGETIEILLNPKRNEKIKATIVWTDRPGTPVAQSVDPTDLMLVNDLDMRIVDDGDHVSSPWILDPSNPDAPASTGDNFRDNVEKIEFNSPDPRTYRLIVSHKGTLVDGEQKFSLVLEYTPIEDERTAMYWIGGSGDDWNDPSKWSLSSGGAPANDVPDASNRVFIDENSFGGSGQVLSLSQNAACASLTWLSDDPASLELNGFTLTVEGDIYINSEPLIVSNEGTIVLTGDASSNELYFGGADLGQVDFVFNDDGHTWNILDDLTAKSFQVLSGNVKANGINLLLRSLTSTGSTERSIDVSSSTISGIESIDMNFENLAIESNNVVVETSSAENFIFSAPGITLDGSLILKSPQSIIADVDQISNVQHLDGELSFNNDLTINSMEISEGVVVKILAGKEISLTSQTVINSSSLNKTQILVDGAGSASIRFNEYSKLCFDNLVVDGIDITGEAVVNAGINSTLTNSENWLQENCSDVLFPKFTVSSLCAGGLTQFTDLSEGPVSSRDWDFGNPSSGANASTIANPWHSYSTPGVYIVSLEISNGTEQRSFMQEISIIPNTLPVNQVVLSNERLFSVQEATSYQWYKNNEPIEDATERGFDFEGQSGVYFVVTKSGSCSRISPSYTILNADSDEPIGEGVKNIKVFPNPASSVLTVEVPQEYLPGKIVITDLMGRKVLETRYESASSELDLNSIEAGVYFFQIQNGGVKYTLKIIVSK